MAKWIKLSEQTPPDSEENLAYLVNWDNGGIWVSVWVSKQKIFIDERVSHWMKLPKPPKDI